MKNRLLLVDNQQAQQANWDNRSANKGISLKSPVLASISACNTDLSLCNK